jgi:hypothetical protein
LDLFDNLVTAIYSQNSHDLVDTVA